MGIFVGLSEYEAESIASHLTKERIIDAIEKVFTPSIGDIKYVMRPTLEVIDINSSDFDGWVYANGYEYAKVDFPSAYDMFSKSYEHTASTFKLPNLNLFAKPIAENSFAQYVPGTAPIENHYHKVDSTIEYTEDYVLSTAFTIVSTGTSNHCINDGSGKSGFINIENKNWYKNLGPNRNHSYYPCLHGGRYTEKDRKIEVDLNIKAGVKFTQTNTNETGEIDLNCYPTHILIPVMVYIGKKGK